MVDNANPPNLGNESQALFAERREFSPNYTNPDGGDTFDSLKDCINGLWGRSVRNHISQTNESFACRHPTPMLAKIQSMVAGDNRPSDDKAYAIQAGDFALAGVQQPQYFWHLDGDNLNKGSGAANQSIVQDDQTGGRAYAYVRSNGKPGAATDDDVIGMRTFRKAGGFSAPYLASLSTATTFAGSITVRVCEWPQANERIVLLATKHRQIDAETGATDRMGFEFGLGPSNSPFPGNSDQAYALYLRWINSDNIEQFLVNEIEDDFEAAQGVGVTPGYEWTLGFHLHDPGGGNVVDFYVNGKFKHQAVNLTGSSLVPGNSTSIRLLVGAGSDGKQFAGGPIRNVMLHTTALDPPVVASLMEFLYQKGAGFI